MSTQFFSKLSKNNIKLLDDEYHYIIIEVGEDPNVKFVRAYRSPYQYELNTFMI
jgi:hypothetical protein